MLYGLNALFALSRCTCFWCLISSPDDKEGENSIKVQRILAEYTDNKVGLKSMILKTNRLIYPIFLNPERAGILFLFYVFFSF